MSQLDYSPTETKSDCRVAREENLLRATPWSVAVAIGFGIAGFIVSRRLFRQSKPTALVQGYLVAASTLGSMKAEQQQRSL